MTTKKKVSREGEFWRRVAQKVERSEPQTVFLCNELLWPDSVAWTKRLEMLRPRPKEYHGLDVWWNFEGWTDQQEADARCIGACLLAAMADAGEPIYD